MRSYHPPVDRNNPEAFGVCDRCQQTVLYKTLQREMVQTGDKLTWNGLLICSRPRCMDKPQQQNRKRVAIVDPIPIKNPRSDQPVTATVSSWINIATRAGLKVLPLNSVTGFVNGDTVRIVMDNNQLLATTITAIGATTITVATALPYQCTTGNMVIDITQSG